MTFTLEHSNKSPRNKSFKDIEINTIVSSSQPPICLDSFNSSIWRPLSKKGAQIKIKTTILRKAKTPFTYLDSCKTGYEDWVLNISCISIPEAFAVYEEKPYKIQEYICNLTLQSINHALSVYIEVKRLCMVMPKHRATQYPQSVSVSQNHNARPCSPQQNRMQSIGFQQFNCSQE